MIKYECVGCFLWGVPQQKQFKTARARVPMECLRSKIGVQELTKPFIVVDVDPLTCSAVVTAELLRIET